MKNFPYSIVLICPTNRRAQANLISVVLGHDRDAGNTFTVPLSPTGTGSPTHFGCHTVSGPEFRKILNDAQRGFLPAADWGSKGLSVADVSSTFGAFVVSIRDDIWGRPHFDEVLSQRGLAEITGAEAVTIAETIGRGARFMVAT